MPNFRYFPLALYLYVLGAAGFSSAVTWACCNEPSLATGIVMLTSTVAIVAGYFMTRPYIRLAKAAIQHLATDRVEAKRSEKGEKQ